MPLGDGIGWNILAPADTDLRSVGAAEIRDVRTGVGIRVDKEHRTLNSSAAPAEGGEHEPGSAVAYTQATAPTLRPDSGPGLTSQDNGRLWVDSDDNILAIYIDPNWVFVSPRTASGRIVAATMPTVIPNTVDVAVGFVPSLFTLIAQVNTTPPYISVWSVNFEGADSDGSFDFIRNYMRVDESRTGLDFSVPTGTTDVRITLREIGAGNFPWDFVGWIAQRFGSGPVAQ